MAAKAEPAAPAEPPKSTKTMVEIVNDALTRIEPIVPCLLDDDGRAALERLNQRILADMQRKVEEASFIDKMSMKVDAETAEFLAGMSQQVTHTIVYMTPDGVCSEPVSPAELYRAESDRARRLQALCSERKPYADMIARDSAALLADCEARKRGKLPL